MSLPAMEQSADPSEEVFVTTLRGRLTAVSKLLCGLAFAVLLVLVRLWHVLAVGHQIIFLVVGVLFPFSAAACVWYLGRTNRIRINATRLSYDNLPRRVVPLSAITRLTLSTARKGRDSQWTVLVLHLEYGVGQTLDMFLNYYERPGSLLHTLGQRSGRSISMTPEAETFLQQL